MDMINKRGKWAENKPTANNYRASKSYGYGVSNKYGNAN